LNTNTAVLWTTNSRVTSGYQTGCTTKEQWFDSWQKYETCCLLKSAQTSSGAKPSLLFHAYLGSFSAIQEPSCKSDNSPPSSAQVKYDWTCTFFPLMTSLGQF